MQNKEPVQGLQPLAEELGERIAQLSEKQDSQYTDIMMAIRNLAEELKERNKDNYSEEELYEEARELVVEQQRASASLLQRSLQIGYARAARILDLLEERGVIGPADGKPRTVLISE